jgi:hypothetical protein
MTTQLRSRLLWANREQFASPVCSDGGGKVRAILSWLGEQVTNVLWHVLGFVSLGLFWIVDA